MTIFKFGQDMSVAEPVEQPDTDRIVISMIKRLGFIARSLTYNRLDYDPMP